MVRPAAQPEALRAVETRLLAGVLVHDTPLVTRAIEYAREHSEPYLFNHVKGHIAQIVDEFPRLEMKQRFTRAVCGIVETRPATTYDNFARDFGERFVPGYKRPSTVDFLLNSQFGE
jgi:hypothetical protein